MDLLGPQELARHCPKNSTDKAKRNHRPELTISKSSMLTTPSIRTMMLNYFSRRKGSPKLSKFAFEKMLEDEVHIILEDRSVWENDAVFGSFVFPGIVLDETQQELMRHAAYMILIKRVYMSSLINHG